MTYALVIFIAWLVISPATLLATFELGARLVGVILPWAVLLVLCLVIA